LHKAVGARKYSIPRQIAGRLAGPAAGPPEKKKGCFCLHSATRLPPEEILGTFAKASPATCFWHYRSCKSRKTTFFRLFSPFIFLLFFKFF
jgi:hypothetical protein